MDYKLPEAELKLAECIWKHGEMTSTELVKLCESTFQWKKSTTYTLLKRLNGRGVIQNLDGKVSALMSRQEYEAGRSRQFVEESFNSSLPKFLAAFSRNRKLSQKEIIAIKQMIEQYEEE